MTDLSLASHAEIVAEIGRRYSAYVFVVLYQAEGVNGLQTRVEFSSNRGFPEPYGLAMMAAGSIQMLSLAKMAQLKDDTPLDPPFPPR